MRPSFPESEKVELTQFDRHSYYAYEESVQKYFKSKVGKSITLWLYADRDLRRYASYETATACDVMYSRMPMMYAHNVILFKEQNNLLEFRILKMRNNI